MKAFYSILLLAVISAQTTAPAPTPYDPSADKTPIVIKPSASSTTTASGPNTPPMPSSTTPNQPNMPSSKSSSSQSSTTTTKSSDAYQVKAIGSVTAFAFVLSYFL